MSAEYEIHVGTLYDYTAGVNVGVLVKENVMRKLAKLQAQHLEAVKRLLVDESERGNVFPSMWTLHYPDGQQTVVRYIDRGANLSQNVAWATIAPQPRAEPLVFMASTMAEAEAMADARHEALKGGAP